MNAMLHPVADQATDAPDEALAALLAGRVPEDDIAFYRRRALEEAAAAQRARTPHAAAAHRYLSGAYAEQVRRAEEAEARFAALIEALG